MQALYQWHVSRNALNVIAMSGELLLDAADRKVRILEGARADEVERHVQIGQDGDDKADADATPDRDAEL